LPARTKRRRRPSSWRFFLFLFFLLACFYGLFYLLTLPAWNITDVAVSGAKILSPDELKALSTVPIGENIFFANLSRTRQNLSRVVAIKSLHVWRIPPSTILIKISERTPMAVLVTKGRSAIIDDDGYILNKISGLTLNIPNVTDLPVFSGFSSKEVNGADRIDPKITKLIKDLMEELAPLLGNRQLQLDTGGMRNISFLLNDILRVKIGRNEAIKTKMAVFKRLLPVIEGRWILVEYIDVRYPDVPVIKYK